MYLICTGLYASPNWITYLDFNYRYGFMIWLENTVNGFEINLSPIHKDMVKYPKYNNVHRVVIKDYQANGLAYDWIHNLVYISVTSGIEVYNIDDHMSSIYKLVLIFNILSTGICL